MNNSSAFIIFCFLTALILLLVRNLQIKKFFLLLSSVYFFIYINNIQLLIASLVFLCLIYIINIYPSRKNVYLYICSALGIFLYLKADFAGLELKKELNEVALPSGISFILFQSIALLLDRKNNIIDKPVRLTDVLGAGIFYPSVLVGPFYKIQKYLSGIRNQVSSEQVYFGFYLFSFGLFKFSVSAMLISEYFLKRTPITRVEDLQSLVLLILSSVYLYCNFSGISDIATGTGQMMGFNLPQNFRFPFFSTSMSEYWRKWHISLGEWFKEFVFYPLNIHLSRKLNYRLSSKISVFVVFFMIGLWHQFSLKILVYSILNGLLVAFFSTDSVVKSRFKKFLLYMITFFLILMINGLFLSKNLNAFAEILNGLFLLSEKMNVFKNILAIITSFTLLAYCYWAEKIILRYTDEKLNSQFFMNSIIAFINLLFAISIGLGGVNAVYTGY